MALLFCDNFENWQSTVPTNPGPWVRVVEGQVNLWGTATSQANVNSSVAGVFRSNTAGVLTGSVWVALSTAFPDSATAIVNTRVAFESISDLDTGSILWFLDGGTSQCSLRFQPNGYFAVYRGLTTTKLAQSINFYPFNTAEYLDIELKIGFHDTTGTIQLRINGVTEINLTNQNTRATANNFANEVRIGRSFGNQSARPYFKQFIIMDTTGATMNDFIGPVDISSLRPNADGNYTAWTALAGDRWDAVNDAITDGDTTYVSSAVPADKVSFQLTDLPAGVTDIFSFYPQAQLKREQGTTRITKFLMRSGVTDSLGTKELAIGPTYAFRQEPISVSPFTAAAWTPAEINALELGMEITT